VLVGAAIALAGSLVALLFLPSRESEITPAVVPAPVPA
jgi:hypothetical protein